MINLFAVYLNNSSAATVTESSMYNCDGDSTGVVNVGVEQLLLTGFTDIDTGSVGPDAGSVCPGAVSK